MGIIKEYPYSKKQEELALIGGATSHPGRVLILELLVEGKSMLRNTELMQVLNLSKPAVKKHLDKLKDAGLIQTKYDVHYHELNLSEKGKKWAENQGLLTN